MSIKTILKKTCFLLFFFTFLSCEENRLVGLESRINEIVEKSKSDTQIRLKMDTISSFDWDSLLAVGPYSILKKISEEENIDLDKIQSTIQHHDSFILIVFLHNNVGTKWIEIERSKKLDNLFKDGNGYSIYPKAKTNFILER